MQNKIILPKPHISWSQYTCWNSNPVRYRKEYFECGKKLDTKYLRFGKGFAGMLEEITANPKLMEDPIWVKNNIGLEITSDAFLNFKEKLVIYEISEHEIRTEVLGVPILSYLDGYDPVNNLILEYKTGKIPWTKAKVIKHGQLLFYAVALKHSVGKTPDHCDLVWVETKDHKEESVDFWRGGEKKVKITGKIVSYPRVFNEFEVEKMENEILRTATEISAAYKSFLKEI